MRTDHLSGTVLVEDNTVLERPEEFPQGLEMLPAHRKGPVKIFEPLDPDRRFEIVHL